MPILTKKNSTFRPAARKKAPLLGFILALSLMPTVDFAFEAYSNDELDQLEKEFVTMINRSNEVERDPLAHTYINQLAKQLAKAGHLPAPDLFIVKSHEINAFAGPGGHIGVNTALILHTENESELAAVLAHEIAHVRLHHLYNQINHQKQMRIPMLAMLLASAALGVVNPALGNGAIMASITSMAQEQINFTRANEKAADRIGIDMLIKAGFDPRAMSSFFKKMQMQTRYYYSANIPPILRSHPLDEERMAEAENRYARLTITEHSDPLTYRLFKEFIRCSLNPNSQQLMDYYQHHCPANNHDACVYGMVLVSISSNHFSLALEKIRPLEQKSPDNLFYALALAESLVGLKDYDQALRYLEDANNNFPDNYPLLAAYGETLMAAGKSTRAAAFLLKASRLYPQDRLMCNKLARAQAAAQQVGYAYFTRATCLLLEGEKKEAIAQLKVARTYAKNDGYLSARIDAKIDEIKLFLGVGRAS